MFYQSLNGRVLGLVTCCVVLSFHNDRLLAADAFASSEPAEVAARYKADGLAEFQLADYEFELLECSALAAVHSLIDDSIGDDSGAEVRNALAKKYWIEVSHDYLSLAQEASGEADLYQEVGIQMRGLVAKWHRLTEDEASADDWAGWYKLTDRCDSWRSDKPAHSYYGNGKEPIAGADQPTKVAMASE